MLHEKSIQEIKDRIFVFSEETCVLKEDRFLQYNFL
jgi:hypothetical protein